MGVKDWIADRWGRDRLIAEEAVSDFEPDDWGTLVLIGHPPASGAGVCRRKAKPDNAGA